MLPSEEHPELPLIGEELCDRRQRIMDSRREPRVDLCVDGPTLREAGGTAAPVRLLDLSRHGFRTQWPYRLQKGKRVWLKIQGLRHWRLSSRGRRTILSAANSTHPCTPQCWRGSSAFINLGDSGEPLARRLKVPQQVLRPSRRNENGRNSLTSEKDKGNSRLLACLKTDQT
jgi:hypothetical protein